MRVNIYSGEKLLFEKKFFYTLERVWNFCKFVLCDNDAYPVVLR